MGKTSQIACVDCFKIKCRGCGWEADDMAVAQIQSGEMTACPMCGWKPGEIASKTPYSPVVKLGICG